MNYLISYPVLGIEAEMDLKKGV
ncbi:uncharacterized protein METZ01_LOCUS187661 [marine metagenome]|uniref:Uncharacterized protein n=1 Tax=marine metagenome TaxID=408172 RepID=A0A382DAW7_9ZZZZ